MAAIPSAESPASAPSYQNSVCKLHHKPYAHAAKEQLRTLSMGDDASSSSTGVRTLLPLARAGVGSAGEKQSSGPSIGARACSSGPCTQSSHNTGNLGDQLKCCNLHSRCIIDDVSQGYATNALLQTRGSIELCQVTCDNSFSIATY